MVKLFSFYINIIIVSNNLCSRKILQNLVKFNILKSYSFSKSMVNHIERKQVGNKNKHYPSKVNLVVHNTKSTELPSYSEDSSEKAIQILNLRNFKRYNETKQNVESFGKSTPSEINTPVKIVGVPFVTPLETLWTGQQYPNVMIRFRDGNERFSGGYNSCACCQSACCCQKLPKLEITPCKYPQATFADQHFHQHVNCMQSKASIPVKNPTSLGAPVGLIQAFSHTDTTTPLLMRFPWYLKAMGLIYLKNIDKWTTFDLDLIIEEGKDPLMYKTENNNKNNDIKEDNKNEETKMDYLETESQIQRSFMFGEFQFKIRLDDATWQENLKINLYEALHKFFKTNTYCLILFGEWYLLIWKQNKIFFVLDMNGRNSKTLFTEEQEKTDNLPVLICLKKLINVVHLIVNMSKLDENESFLVRAIKFAEVIDPEGKVLTHQPDPRTPEYKTINDNYSYLRSNFHLSLNPAKPEINRSGLPVGIAAMIASKIDHPATWDSKTLDRIICYGVNLCRACWPSCGNFKEPINLDTFPRCIHIGQFIANFELKSGAFTGFWKCRPVSLRSEFYAIIKGAFSQNENLLFQINNQMYAIWRKNNFYYLLDPYLHTIWGVSNDIESKMASLHMFRNLDTLIKVFHNILLQSNRSANFYIHTFKVNGLVDSNNCKNEIEMPIEDDLKSLNEYIIFEDDYDTCFNELGQSSDYDDDIESTVFSMLSLTTSLDEGEEEEEEDEGKGKDEDEDDDEISMELALFKSQQKKNKKNKSISNSNIGNKKDKGLRISFILSQSNLADTGTEINSNIKTDIRTESKNNKGTGKKTDINIQKRSIRKDNKNKKKTTTNIKSNTKTSIRTDSKTKKRTDRMSPKKSESITSRRSNKKTDSQTNKNVHITTDTKDNILNSNKNQQKDKYTIILLKNLPKKDMTRRSLAPLNKEATKHQGDAIDTCNKKLRDICNAFKTTDCQKKNLEESCRKSEYNYFMDSFKRPKENIERYSKRHIANKLCDENIYNNRPRPDPFLDHPTLSQQPKNLIISRSSSSTYESILKIFHSGLKCCDRVLISTKYGNFVVFRGHDYLEDLFFVYDGCTCDVNRFRHMDLSTGTAGLIPFSSLHKVITYIMNTKKGTRKCTVHGHTKEESTDKVSRKKVYFNYLRI